MHIFTMAARLRGLNPFRQKIGLWETNYHMAVNSSKVGPRQLITYFDEIMKAHKEFSSYHEVMNTAALTAAIARQYGHLYNRFVNGECYCNEDFAREYFQLFFGILGDYDPQEHEEVTIKNMAAALSGMSLIQGDAPEEYLGDQLEYGSEQHPDISLRMLETDNDGANTEQRISALSPLAIEHPESEDALPLMIVMGLADDELSEREANALKTAWRSMQDKDLLRFIQAYAVSTLFHSANRVKRWTSIDRHLLVANLFADRNNEHLVDLYAAVVLVLGREHPTVQPAARCVRPSNRPRGRRERRDFPPGLRPFDPAGISFLAYRGAVREQQVRRVEEETGGTSSSSAITSSVWPPQRTSYGSGS